MIQGYLSVILAITGCVVAVERAVALAVAIRNQWLKR